jgi:hypothetical protein
MREMEESVMAQFWTRIWPFWKIPSCHMTLQRLVTTVHAVGVYIHFTIAEKTSVS